MSNSASIKAKLKSIAMQEGKPFDFFLMHYFIERLLYRLSVSQYSGNFILKGGLLLYAVLDEDARATKDIDLLAYKLHNIPEELAAVFAKIAVIPADDSLRFDPNTLSVERIRETAEYQGVRIKLTGYLDNSRHVLQLDIGFGDVVYPKPVYMDYPSLLEMDRPRIKAYSLESVIAEKFQAMLYLSESNSRMKDFYDIYTLSRSMDFDGHTLFEAVFRTIQRRATPYVQMPTVFSDTFLDLKDKQTQWRAFQRRLEIADGVAFSEILSGIRSFLLPIYRSMQVNSEFHGKWSHETAEWSSTL